MEVASYDAVMLLTHINDLFVNYKIKFRINDYDDYLS
jgi:hypothetical protein